MITIDRTSGTSVHDQLLEQLRYQIASGQYKVDDPLPSTRKLADQLGLSFHTVRKVYQTLEQEGVLDARQGSAYVVKQRQPRSKSERMERGASVVLEALQRLVGLGLDESEIDYLVQEQMALLEGATARPKLVVLAAFREMAELCAEQFKHHLQQPVEAAVLADLAHHQDADYIVSTLDLLRSAMSRVPRADVRGFTPHLRPEALERVARLSETQSLALVTRYADGIAPLADALRAQTGYGGAILSVSLDATSKPLDQAQVREVDLLLYSPLCRRRLRPILDSVPASAELGVVVSRDSLEAIRQAVPA